MLIALLLLGLSPSEAIEVGFDPSEPFALAIEAGETRASLSARHEDGAWRIELTASEGGRSLVGAEPRFPPEQYCHRLDGTYSIVARQPDGRLKVLRDRRAGTLRSFWGFEAEIAGERRRGWIELAPLPLPKAEALSVRPIGNVIQAESRSTIPTHDRDDRATGFKAVLRDYHWSGTDGKAWVISFDERCRWHGQDVKLVFPEGGAWVPGYQLSQRHMVQFEFIETWGGGAQGCFEPMSDRVDRFGAVELVEDRDDRKTLRWTYQLANPDYIRWGELAGGKQSPEVEELWTVFPDGMAVRRQRYWPCLDSALEQHVLGNQVAELDVVWASDTAPEDVTPENAATVFSASHVLPVRYPSQRAESDPKFGPKPLFGVAVHSLDPALPDVFALFSQAHATNPPYQISTDDGPDWHRERFWRFSHFPFGLQPFEYETNSQTEGMGQISHSSLVYVGAPADRHWESTFEVDERGRKYREWTTVVGLDSPKAFRAMLARYGRSIARLDR